MDSLSAHGLRADYQPSRRGFLIAMIGAGVMLGYARSAFAVTQFLHPAKGSKINPAELFEPTIWYGIDREGIVEVSIIRAEIGQHVGTALARIVADELEADWDKVRITYVKSAPKWGVMITGASWSVWQSFPLLSRAGAAGRITLIEEGAKLLGTSPQRCAAHNGVVTAGGRSISYGEIITHGDMRRNYTPEQLDKMPIKTPVERRLIGKNTTALDIPSKTNGSARYGIDAAIDGMIFARPKIPPTRYDSTVVAIDDSAAQNVPGYMRTIELKDPTGIVPGWVMVFADSYPAAYKAAELVNVQWKSGEAARISESDLHRHAAEVIADHKRGVMLVDDRGVDPAFAAAKHLMERTYSTSTVMHFALEPINALAFERDGMFEIHASNQWQTLAVSNVAKALGRSPDKVVVVPYLVGGGFGRRLDFDYTVPVALAAQAVGRPVKMVLSRPDDMRFDCPRSPSLQVLRMAFDNANRVIAMEHNAVAGTPTAVIVPQFMLKNVQGRQYDEFSIQGADHWYDVGAQRVRLLKNDLANRVIRPGWLRSVGSGWVNWALESFMDEAAHEVGTDPVAFRLQLLDGKGRNAGTPPNSVGGAHRQAAMLRRAAEKAGWGQPVPKDVGLGAASTFGQERTMPTWVACIARVRVDRSTGRVTVEKLTLVVDAGTIIHPDGAEAQVQGGALWGLSMALHEGSQIVNGQPKDTNLDSYTPLRMGDVPEIEVELMPSTETPVGLGEPATTAVAPAVANAIFAATGARVRDLPIRPEAVLKALSHRT